MDVFSVIKLDYAFRNNKCLHLLLLSLLKSENFNVDKVFPSKRMKSYVGPPPPQHLYTKMVNWLFLRQVKVVEFKLHQHCCYVVLEKYLQAFGEHVRYMRPEEDYNRPFEEQNAPTQSQLISKYCHNLTGFSVNTYKQFDGNILRILNNNTKLKTLYIMNEMFGENNPSKTPSLTLPRLKQLVWAIKHGFDDSLVALAKAAPNLQQLSLSCNPDKTFEIEGALIIAVANACPNLRTFSCNEMHLGTNDSSLKDFLSICRHIVNLDLRMHYELSDEVLIAALSSLHGLQYLDLRGCCRLTVKTLQFLAQRFASTLNTLHLDYSVYPDYLYVEEDEEGNLVLREKVKGGYTAAGVVSLRAQCSFLHTYSYTTVLEDEEEDAPPVPVEAYQLATIVQKRTKNEQVLLNILEHCHQMQTLAMTCDRCYGRQVWLTVEQLKEIAARCPQLRMVVCEKKNYGDGKDEVDYTSVKEAFSELIFTRELNAVDFDILKMPV